MSGWISLHRKIMDHPFYTEKRKFSRYEAWIDLIMLANHQDNKFMLGNQLVEVKRGSFITSELKLMDKWDWGKEKVRGFLKLLESDGMIIREAKKYTLITICNYEKHSSKSDRNEPSDSKDSDDVSDRQQTDSRPTADREPYTNNNVNKGNKVKNDNKYKETIVEIINYLNESTGKSFSPDTKETIKLISGRLTEGKTLEQFIRVINVKTAEWLQNEKMCAWLKPNTLFAQSNFEAYLNQLTVIKGGQSNAEHKGRTESAPIQGTTRKIEPWEELVVGSPQTLLHKV